MNKLSTILDSGVLGIVSGLRSQLPLALLAAGAGSDDPALLHRPTVRWMLYAGAGGEMIGDKLPFALSRLEPYSLAGRMTFGAVAGALLANRHRQPAALGALAGCAGAVVGSYAGYHVRAYLGRLTGLPDPTFAVIEDGIAISLGLAAIGD